MSEPLPKRHKLDDNETIAANPQIIELGLGEGPADANGDLEGAPEYVVDVLAAELEECQKALDKVNDEASDRVLAVEQEYNKKRRPIYAERAEIIRKVPQFWQRVLSSHPTLADLLTDDDLAILEYVTELDVVDSDDIKSGYRVVMTFAAENPFFTNPSLTKSFHYSDDGKITIAAADIHWNEGHAPVPESLEGTLRPSYLFFDWMAANEPLGHGTPDEISEIIKEEVWPNPVKYYYSLAQGQREYEDVVDEGALVEAEDLEGVLVQAADEGEGEEELVYDEGEGELDALGGDEGDGGAEGGTGFADDEGEGAPGL